MKNIILPIMISAFTTLFVQAQTTSDVELEKAIFLQETKKDYEAAASIFATVLEESKKEDLETLYRLSQCQKQLGQKERYIKSISELSVHKEQTNKWVQLAVKEEKEAIKFLKPLWEDGDVLIYDSSVEPGVALMTIIYTELPEQSAWKVEVEEPQRNIEITFDDSNFQLLSGKIVYDEIREEPEKIYVKGEEKDFEFFGVEFIAHYLRTFPFDYTRRSFKIAFEEGNRDLIIYRTKYTKTIYTEAGGFECSEIIVEVPDNNEKTTCWVNTKGKHEIIRMYSGGNKMDLIDGGKKEN